MLLRKARLVDGVSSDNKAGGSRLLTSNWHAAEVVLLMLLLSGLHSGQRAAALLQPAT